LEKLRDQIQQPIQVYLPISGMFFLQVMMLSSDDTLQEDFLLTLESEDVQNVMEMGLRKLKCTFSHPFIQPVKPAMERDLILKLLRLSINEKRLQMYCL